MQLKLFLKHNYTWASQYEYPLSFAHTTSLNLNNFAIFLVNFIAKFIIDTLLAIQTKVLFIE